MTSIDLLDMGLPHTFNLLKKKKTYMGNAIK